MITVMSHCRILMLTLKNIFCIGHVFCNIKTPPPIEMLVRPVGQPWIYTLGFEMLSIMFWTCSENMLSSSPFR